VAHRYCCQTAYTRSQAVQRQVVTLPDLTGPNLRVGGASAPTIVDAIAAAVLGRRRVAARAGGGLLAGASRRIMQNACAAK